MSQSQQTTRNERRGFFKTVAGVAATAAASPALFAGVAQNESGGAYLRYERRRIGSLKTLKRSGTLSFSYPDRDSPCTAVLIEGEVKAYSTLCSHKGCPLMYNAANQTFVCPCHFSKFDAAKDGEMIIGQATEELPRIYVEVKGDDIVAYGIDGLVFGRESNKLS
jgi:arsenite oxidase small subunit